MRADVRVIPSLVALAVLTLLPLRAGAEVSGQFSESAFYQTDDATNQNYGYFRSKLKLDASGQSNSFHFDGSWLSPGQNTFNSQIPRSRIEALNVKMEKAFPDTDLVFGRQQVNNLPWARVDGALIEGHLSEGGGIGAFGGTAPDPYTDAFSGAFTTMGAYGFYRNKVASFATGYAETLFNGLEDQAYIFGSGNLAVGESLDIWGNFRLDHNLPGTNGFEPTDMLVSINYRWGWRGYLNLSYDQYRAIWYQESMTYNINLDLQRTARVYGDFNLTRSSKVYADYDYRTRESDGGTATMYMLGLRQSDLPFRLYYDASYRGVNYFTMQSWQGRLAVGSQPTERSTVEASGTYIVNTQNGMANDMNQTVYSLSANWMAAKKLYVGLLAEYSDQRFLSVDSVLLAKYSDEYRTTSVYANITYRF